MLFNSAGIFSLFGLIAVMMNFQKLGDKAEGTGAIIWTAFGAIFLIIWIVNFQFSRASEFKQGIYDLMFGAYLVKHVPTEGEQSSGFWAKLENMGNYGDQFAARREANKQKKLEKTEESKDEESDKTSGEKEEDKPKAKAKAKAKPKAKKASK